MSYKGEERRPSPLQGVELGRGGTTSIFGSRPPVLPRQERRQREEPPQRGGARTQCESEEMWRISEMTLIDFILIPKSNPLKYQNQIYYLSLLKLQRLYVTCVATG